MKVKDLMLTEIFTISQNATYEEAAHLLTQKDVSGLLVVDDNNQLIGVLSEKDLFRVLYPWYGSFYEHPEWYTDQEKRESKIQDIRHHAIKDYVSKPPITVSPETPIFTAGALMLAKHIHRLPVVDNGKVVGIVTRSHIYGAILEQNFGR